MARTSVVYDLVARDKATKTFNTVGRSAQKLEKRTSKVSQGFAKLGTAAVRTGQVIGAAAVTGIAAAATMGVKTAASLEQARIGFETLLGSGQKAEAFLAQLKTFAAKTPFELPGLIQNARQLLGVGVAANKVIPTLRTLGDTSGALGLSQDQYNRILLAYSQILSKGKVQAEEVLQLTEAGIPAYQLLAKALHKPVPELQAMMKSGKLLAKDALPALLQQMHKDYGGAMVKQSRTLAGVWSTLKDTINLALADAIEPMIPLLRSAVPDAATLAGGAIHGFAGAFTAVITNAKKAVTFVKDFLTGAGVIHTQVKVTPGPLQASAFAAPESQASKLGTQLSNALSNGISGIDTGTLGAKLGDALRKAIGWIGQHIGELEKKMLEAFAKIDWLNIGKQVGAQAVPFAIGLVGGLLDPVAIFNSIKAHPMDWVLALTSFLAVGKIGGIVAKILGKVPILKVFAPLLNWLHRLTGPINKAIGGLLRALGRGFVTGFTKVFPNVAKSLGHQLSLLPTRIGVAAITVAEKARALARGIGRGILKGAEALGRIIGTVIGKLVKPFAKAGSWLVDKGRKFVSGLVKGIGSWISKAVAKAKEVGSKMRDQYVKAGVWLLNKGKAFVSGLIKGVGAWIGRAVGKAKELGSRIRDQYIHAGVWLYGKGKALVGGLKNGIVNAIRGIGGWVKSHIVDPVINAVKHFFGIHSPSKVFHGIGGNLIKGLLKGMAATSGAAIARKIFGDMPSALGAIVSKGLVSISSLPGRAMRALGGLGGKLAGLLGIGGAPGNVSGNAAIVKRLAAARGWIGGQWSALYKLIQGESGFRNTAQNPTSSAYGMFQFLNSTWAGVGGHKTSDPFLQSVYGLRYIASSYGTPANAYAKWSSRSPHWYGSGLEGGVFRKPTLIGVGERGAERVDVTPLGRGGDGARQAPLIGQLNIHHVPGYSTPQDVMRGLRQGELALRYHRRR